MTYIIAEMACSHEGQPELAKFIIDAAGKAGANAVQYQVWQLDEIMVPSHPGFELGGTLEMSQDEWAELMRFNRATYPDMEIIACVNDLPSIQFCEDQQVDAYKIHSSDISNPMILEGVAKTGRRIDLSVGASTQAEIEDALTVIRSFGDPEIWMMYGYQSFPTPTDGIHLRFLNSLRETYGLPVGYQDHSDADSQAAFRLPAAAMGMEVEVLEKHITHDRSKKGVDHQAALNPDEFSEFVAMVREIDQAKGISGFRQFGEAEEKYRIYSKKSIVAAADLPEGHVLKAGDLRFMRTEELGMPPDRASDLVSKTLQRKIDKFGRIGEQDVK